MPAGFFFVSIRDSTSTFLLIPAMRVPFLIAIPTCLIMVSLIWWLGTHKMDFLAQPSEAKLQQIRSDALASLPVSTMQDDAISVRVPPPQPDTTVSELPTEVGPVEIGDVSSPPVLDTYSDRAPEGSEKLLALAEALEKQGTFQRALLAYERVLDLSQSNPEQIQTAVNSIQRLKPTLPLWNSDSASAIPITLHIGTGVKFSKILPDILDKVSSELATASSGLVTPTYQLNIGRSIQDTDAPTPVALWITGGAKGTPSTDVLSFTTDDPETLRHDILKTAFNLIRSYLAKSASHNPPPEITAEPLLALENHLTRLLWSEFAGLLNPPVEPDQ